MEKKVIVEKLDILFVSVFTEEDSGMIPLPELNFTHRDSEELRQLRVRRSKVLGLIDN